MSEVATISTIQDLYAFANEKGIVEIVIRGAHKRYKVFQKIAIDDLPQQEQEAARQKIMSLLEKNVANSERKISLLKNNNALNNKNFKLLSQVVGTNKIGLLLSGANLCATCAGFAIVVAELKRVESNLSDQISKLDEDVKKINETWGNYRLREVMEKHNHMLDCFRIQKPFSEEQLRELVAAESNVLETLIEFYEKNAAVDKEGLLFSILSLLSMFTTALRYFDESYYFNNHANIKDGDWYTSHDEWMKVYGKLTGKPFVEKYQDYAMLEEKMNTREADIFYISIIDQIKDLEQQVKDNQELVKAVGNQDSLQKVREVTIEEVKRVISETLQEACYGVDSAEIKAAYEKAYKLAASA